GDSSAAPGTTWIYNNGGWLLLATAIERITGQPIEQVMWERLFEPIGMHNSLYAHNDVGFMANRGTQHVLTPGGGFERMSWGVGGHCGAGALISTVDDMLRWLKHMDTPRVGNAATWAAMRRPQSIANGTSTGYALGLIIDHYRGAEVLFHGGNA